MIHNSFLSTFALLLAMSSGCLATSSSSASSINSNELTRPILPAMVDPGSDSWTSWDQGAIDCFKNLRLKDWKRLDPTDPIDKAFLTMMAEAYARSGNDPANDIDGKLNSESCCSCFGEKIPASIIYFRHAYLMALYKVNKDKQHSETVNQQVAEMQKQLEELSSTINAQNARIEELRQTPTEEKDTGMSVSDISEKLREVVDQKIAEQKQLIENMSRQVKEVKVPVPAHEDLDQIHSQIAEIQQNLKAINETLKWHGKEIGIMQSRIVGICSFKALVAAQAMYAEYQSSGTEAQRATTLDELVDEYTEKMRTVELKGYENLGISDDEEKRFNDKLKTKCELETK